MGRFVKGKPDDERVDNKGTAVGVGRSKVVTGIVMIADWVVGCVELNCAVLCQNMSVIVAESTPAFLRAVFVLVGTPILLLLDVVETIGNDFACPLARAFQTSGPKAQVGTCAGDRLDGMQGQSQCDWTTGRK